MGVYESMRRESGSARVGVAPRVPGMAVEKLEGFGDDLATVRPNMHQSRAVLSLNRTPSYNVSKS